MVRKTKAIADQFIHLQLLWRGPDPVLLLLTALIVLADEATSDDKDIRLFKLDSFIFCTCLQFVDCKAMRGPRIIRQWITIASEVPDEVKEDSSTTNTMLSPVWCIDRSQITSYFRHYLKGVTYYECHT